MQDITVREMDFGLPDELDPVVVEGEPEVSYVIVGLSLLLPYLEPYLIRTMKEARKQVTDPDLRADLEHFSAQEGQHYRQHMRFNDAIRGFGFPGLQAYEDALDSDYRRFTRTRSLRWNLAYAEGFEALTTAVAHASFEAGSDPRMHPTVADLFAWHLIEELEHRTVAFDVYDHVCGSYPYRLAVGTWAQWHMARWIGGVARYMRGCDPRMETEFGGEAGRAARRRDDRGRMLLRKVVPRVLRTYSPWYTPHGIPMTEEMRAMANAFSERAVRTHS